MKYKTAEEILDESAENLGYIDFTDMLSIEENSVIKSIVLSRFDVYASQFQAPAGDKPSQPQQNAISVIEERIKELKEIDANFCEKRWDMSKPEFERKMYREQSNCVTFARQDYEKLLTKLKK